LAPKIVTVKRDTADLGLAQREANEIRLRIESGELGPGEPIPTIASMKARGVSVTTARAAHDLLRRWGLVKGGRGAALRVLVRSVLDFHGSASESMLRLDERLSGPGAAVDAWVADCVEQGHIGTQVISVEREPTSAVIAALLELPVGTAVVIRRRRRSVDGEPHNTSDSYYPASLVAGTLIERACDIPEGVIAYMKRELGIEQVRYQDAIEARPADAGEIGRLGILAGWPVIVQTRVGYTTERPVRVTVTVWPADRSRLVYGLPA
jgi:GntR family transcriptional regulator